jgi:hypothetical protein
MAPDFFMAGMTVILIVVFPIESEKELMDNYFCFQ